MVFNDKVNPKAKTEFFKIYADVSGTGLAPEWELQGRGVESWTVEENQDVEKTTDVLGYVDMERGTAQPTQSGVAIKLRKGSKFAEMLFNAWFKRDTSKLDAVKMIHKKDPTLDIMKIDVDDQKVYKMKVTLPQRLNDEDVKVSIVPLDKPSPHTDCGLHNVILKLLRR